MKKKAVQELIDDFVGKGKVTIIRIEKTDKNKWIVHFKEKGKTQQLEFNSVKEAQDFALAFEGKNYFSVAAPYELLKLKGWSYERLFDLGHKVISMTIGKSYAKNQLDRVVPHPIPENCGVAYLGGSAKKGTPENAIIKETISSGDKIGSATIQFTEPTQIDDLVTWFNKKLPNIETQIQKAVTRNHETGVSLTWERKRVGDGSKRMEFRCTEVNGQDYTKTKFHTILSHADGMAERSCERVFVKNTKTVTKEMCGESIVS